QRTAIRTGDPCGIVIQGTTTRATGWSIVRKVPGSSQVVVESHLFASDVIVSATGNEMWFDFEGTGSELFQVRLEGTNRAYQIEVVPLSQMIHTEEVAK
ncbi:MAG: hypothetical protein KDB00_06145, partial [Planctomycetales bacterium]|nr:hypothetical protein [Planctomycetales bacterium]